MKKTPEQLINEMRIVVQGLSLKIVEKMTNGEKVEPDEIKHINEVKKYLKFAENLQKEINAANGISTKSGKSSSFSPDMVSKIKKLQSNIGDIVRQMPTK